MIVHVVETLVKGGASEILVLLNLHNPQSIMEILEDGGKFGASIYYRYVLPVDGPGRQLWLAKEWVAGEDFIVMLGDSIFFTRLDFHGKKAPHIWTMPLEGLDDPSKYGQVETAGDRVITLREKPAELFSPIIQTGIWLMSADAFDKAERIGQRTEGEVHIGDLALEYVAKEMMTHTRLPAGSYLDVGTPEALHQAGIRMRQLKSAK